MITKLNYYYSIIEKQLSKKNFDKLLAERYKSNIAVSGLAGGSYGTFQVALRHLWTAFGTRWSGIWLKEPSL
jgi:hypothetical protein